MNKRRIVFVISRFLDGGMETVLIEYLRQLSKLQKYHLTLLIVYKTGELEVYHDRLPEGIDVKYLVSYPILIKYKKERPSGPMARGIKLLDEIFLNPLRRATQSYRLQQITTVSDVIVDFDHSQASFLKNIKIPKIAFFHASISTIFNTDPVQERKIKKKITVYDHIVTISEAMYQEACHYFPNVKERICMIYNTVDTDVLLHSANAVVEDGRINKPYILSVTRLEENQKDVTTLIDAYEIFRTKYGHTEELYVIGKGESLEQLQHKARHSRVAEHIHFLGFMINPYPWVKRAKLFVHSAKFEGLPTNLIEALLLDRMIVATDCPTGPGEILNHGQAGILPPVGNKEELAKAMHEALTDQELIHKISVGRNEHKCHFTFEETGKKFCKLLE